MNVDRDRYGRYLIPPPDGGKPQPHTRVTTIAKTLDDEYNLSAWKQRMVAVGLSRRPDLVALAAATDPDDRAALNRICGDAMTVADAARGANLGTALHAFTETIDRGGTPVAPPETLPDIAAYTDTIPRRWIDQDWVETIVVHNDLRIAGTFDRILQLDDGRAVIADIKTTQNIHYGWHAIAVQLALYAQADYAWDPDTGRRPLPDNLDLEHGLVIWLPAGQGRCELFEVDLAAGWTAATWALTVRDWRRRDDLHRAYTPGAPPVDVDSEIVNGYAEIRRWLTDVKQRRPDVAAAVNRDWPEGVPPLSAGVDQFTAQHVARVQQLIRRHEWRDQPPGFDERRRQLIARLETYPAAVLEHVTAAAKTAGVPNLRSNQVTSEHLDLIEQLLQQQQETGT